MLANNNKPYDQIWKLYTMHLCYSFVAKSWDTAIILFIAQLTNNSLRVVALCGFLSSLSIFLFMTSIGRWLDKSDRLIVVKTSLIIKLIAVTTAYLICAFLINYNNIIHTTLFTIFLYLLPILFAITGVCFSTINQSVEKDWLVVLSDGNTDWLTNTNAVMSQIDLLCNSLAPVSVIL